MEENNQELNQEVTSTEQVNVQEENNQTKFKAVGQINEKKPKKKKGKAGKIIFFLLIIAIIAGIVGYFGIYTNPKVVYQQILKTGVNYFTAVPEDVTTSKTKIKLDVDLNLNEDYISETDQEVIDLINNIDAMLEVQMDTNEKKAICKFASNYENEELLNFDVLMDVENRGTYIKISQFFDDILEIEMDDEYYDDLELALTNEQEIKEEQLARSKAIKIISDEMAKMIKNEYCSKETEYITLDKDEIKTEMYILKMTSAQLVSEVRTVLENLIDNEEYLNCFEDKEEEKESLLELLETFNEAEGLEDETICIKMYRAGLKQELVRVDFEVQYQEEQLTLKVEKLEKSYKLEISIDEEVCCTGIVEIEELDDNLIKTNIKLEAEDIGSIGINIESSYVTNEPIDAIEAENATKMEDLSTDDILDAYNKLEDSKIYDFVEDILLLAYDI